MLGDQKKEKCRNNAIFIECCVKSYSLHDARLDLNKRVKVVAGIGHTI
jgi:hypothetical protein